MFVLLCGLKTAISYQGRSPPICSAAFPIVGRHIPLSSASAEEEKEQAADSLME